MNAADKTIDDLRKEFEAWWQDWRKEPVRTEDYFDGGMQLAWLAWRASRQCLQQAGRTYADNATAGDWWLREGMNAGSQPLSPPTGKEKQ